MLTDEEFFTGLNLEVSSLKEVRTAVERGDTSAAVEAFARYFRLRKSPCWFFDWRDGPRLESPRPDTEHADRYLKHEWFWNGRWFDLGEDIDWSSNQMTEGESATIEWNAALNRHYHLLVLAEAYWRTGEEKYAEEVITQMLDWIKKSPMIDYSGNSPYHYAWETLNTAIRAGNTWFNALYRVMPSRAVTDRALITILKSLVEHARHLDEYPTRGNWLTMESAALFTVGTMLPEFKESAVWRRHAVERLHMQMKEQVYPDGLEYELALGYNNFVLRNFMNVLELAKLNGRLNELPEDYVSNLERMFNYLVYAVMPNWLVPGLNDSGNASPEELLRLGYKYFPHREDFLWVATRGMDGRRPQKTSVAFPYSGHYVMRSGWDKDSLYLLFDAGPFGAGHQHEDKLHIVLYAYGRQLLLDAGNYMYDRSRWRRYVLSTRGHNTVRVDGCDQNRRNRRETWVLPYPFKPLPNLWVSREEFDYAEGTYDSGYGPENLINVTHRRAIFFVKPRYWIIVDTLKPQDEKEHEYESIFHLDADSAKLDPEDKTVITLNSDTNLAILPLKTPELKAEVIKGRREEPVQGWAGKPWRPVPTAIYRKRVSGTTRFLMVLYPVPPGGSLPVVGVEPLETGPDAAACLIRFLDGSAHAFIYADKGGVPRRYGSFETESKVELRKITPEGEVKGKPLSYP